jgi:predicted PurR-regulated permease PerM
LAHTVFFAAGSYTTALLSTRGGVGSAWLTLLAAVLVAIGMAALIGFVTLRLREFVFSLVTYALAVVAMTIAANWSFLGGSDGIRGIPMLDLSIPGLTLTARNDRELWPYAFTLLALTIYLIDRFRHSALGAAAIMVGVGVLIIGSVDNIARPIFARYAHLELPTVVLLVSIFGGISVLGPGGLILGPLFVRLAIEALRIWRDVQLRRALTA